MRRALATAACLAALTVSAAPAADEDAAPATREAKSEDATLDWSLKVPGVERIKPGEHPRLVFRAKDVPRLKQRAATPEGKAILARMEVVLADKWTLWHGAAYALKYTLTGEKQWADLAREHTDKAIAGTSDRDGRYNFIKPGSGGPMRAGPAMGAVALAYDLAYHGWEPAYRESVAKAIAGNPWLGKITASPPCGLGCNHFGAAVGGAGLAALGVWNDPGVDQAQLDPLLRKLMQHSRNEMQAGWSPYSYYYEGHQCGRISAHGTLPFLLAWRTAFGEDWISDPRSHYRYMGLKWLADTIKTGGGYANPQRGMYGRNFPRDGMVSQTGEFVRAFAAADPAHVPAMKWFYNQVLEPGAKTFDIIEYPHYAIYALHAWPFADVPERNPGESMPKVWIDPGPGYIAFRNAWTGKDDEILVTCLFGQKPDAGRGMGKGGSVMVAGLGREPFAFPGAFWCSKLTHSYAAVDGSGIVSGEMVLDRVSDGKHAKAKADGLVKPGVTSLAVDFSGASGAPLLLAMTGVQVGYSVAYWTDLSALKEVAGDHGKGKGAYGKVSVVDAGGTSFAVMTFTAGEHPPVTAEGKAVAVGKQRITFDGKKLVLATIAGPGPGMPK